MTENQISRSFLKLGIIFTIVLSLSVLFREFTELSPVLNLGLSLLIALSFALSSLGIYIFIKLHKTRPCLIIGLKLSILAAFTFGLASSVGIFLGLPLEEILIHGDQSFTYGLSNRITEGIEFFWQFLFGLSVIFLAIPSINHPKLGMILPLLGIVFGFFIILISFLDFPSSSEPVFLSGLISYAPAWHLLVTVFIILSPTWIIERSSD